MEAYKKKIVPFSELKKYYVCYGWSDNSDTIRSGLPVFVHFDEHDVPHFYGYELDIRVEIDVPNYETKYYLVEKSNEDLIKEIGIEKCDFLLEKLLTRLEEYEIGEHEMDNSWISFSLPTLYCELKERNFTLMGICYLSRPRYDWAGELLDIGICYETNDGEKYWCHAFSEEIEKLVSQYKDIRNKLNEAVD